MSRGRAFAPATIGNVGPGFDVLGLAVDGVGDVVSLDLADATTVEVTGRDASLVPTEPAKNAAAVAARAWLARRGREGQGFRMRVEKGLPLSGGMGGSAASSVAGALAAAAAIGDNPRPEELMEAALAGESAVAGRHLDNIAPCVLGGLALVLSTDPIDAVAVPVAAGWWVALVTPAVRVETRAARAVLPLQSERGEWVRQMAHAAALTHAFATGDAGLGRRALRDFYAEPRRASLVPHFAEVQRAALASGAIGCTLSGAGPTLFALAEDAASAARCASAMQGGFGDLASTVHVGAIARQGARVLEVV